jgi:uncharacterized protein YjbJ (UPF0337 family)
MACGKTSPSNARPNIFRHSGGDQNKINQIKIMNTLEIKGDWNIIKGKLKQKWAGLTDQDLQFTEGRQTEFFGRIQKRTGETREAIEKAVKEFSIAVGR